MVLKLAGTKKFWSCLLQPGCDFLVGAHQRTGEPLGFPVDAETRQLRIELHEICQRYWNYKDTHERKEMYRFLQENTKRGHIAQMTKKELISLKELLNGKFSQKDWTKL